MYKWLNIYKDISNKQTKYESVSCLHIDRDGDNKEGGICWCSICTGVKPESQPHARFFDRTIFSLIPIFWDRIRFY